MRNTTNIFLISSGIMNSLFLIFHLMFYHLFEWEKTLSCLNGSDSGIMLTFNLICILFLVMMTFFPFLFRKDLLETRMGKSLLIVFAMFYSIRIVCEFLFFGFSGFKSIVIIALCLIPIICYLFCVFKQTKKDKCLV